MLLCLLLSERFFLYQFNFKIAHSQLTSWNIRPMLFKVISLPHRFNKFKSTLCKTFSFQGFQKHFAKIRIKIHTRCQKSHVTWYCEALQPFGSNCCRSHCYNRSRSHNSATPPPHDTTHSVVNALITRPNDIRRLRPNSYTSTLAKRYDTNVASTDAVEHAFVINPLVVYIYI